MVVPAKEGVLVASDLSFNVDRLREQLGLAPEHAGWLEALAAVAPPVIALSPLSDDILSLLARLDVPAGQTAELIAARAHIDQYPALRWLLERCVGVLVRDMGGYAPLPPWPPLPASLGAAGRYLYPWVFLSTLPVIRQWHAARGIPDETSWATLADFGLHMAIHQRTYGSGGLSTPNWLTLHFRGGIYRLGRLQFNRSRVRYAAAAIESAGGNFHPGDPALGVHIPEIGPLTPDACDASFRRAPDFFARHFPEDHVAIATCSSWLLDDQLATYLPPDSNIVRFQRRFHRLPGGNVCDDSILQFVFRRIKPPLDDLPQRTTLERAVVAHLRAGGHWYSRAGWVAL